VNIQPFLKSPIRALTELRGKTFYNQLYDHVIMPLFHPASPHPASFLALFTAPYKRKDLVYLTMEMLIDLMVEAFSL